MSSAGEAAAAAPAAGMRGRASVFRQVHHKGRTRYRVWNQHASANSLVTILEDCFRGGDAKTADEGPGLLFFYRALLELQATGYGAAVHELCDKAIARDSQSLLFKSVKDALLRAREAQAKAANKMTNKQAVSKHVLLTSDGETAIKARVGIEPEGAWAGAVVVSLSTSSFSPSLSLSLSLSPSPSLSFCLSVSVASTSHLSLQLTREQVVVDADDGATVGIGRSKKMPKALHLLGKQDAGKVLTALRETSSRGTLPVKVALLRGDISSLKTVGYNGFQLSAAAKTLMQPTVFETQSPLIVDLCLVLSRLGLKDRQRVLHWASVQTNARVVVHDLDIPAEEGGAGGGRLLEPARVAKLVSRFESALRLVQSDDDGRGIDIAREFLSLLFQGSNIFDSLRLERRGFRPASEWVAELRDHFGHVKWSRLQGDGLAAYPIFRAVAWNGDDDGLAGAGGYE